MGPVLPLAGMVDILFLLLVFFMTTSVFREQEKQIDVALPGQQSESTEASPTQITITIGEEGSIFMAGQQFDLANEASAEAFSDRLSGLAEQFPNEAVVVRGDRSTRWGLILRVLDLCRAKGLRNVAAATTKAASEL
jgi:biopolymer transport protein ExbD